MAEVDAVGQLRSAFTYNAGLRFELVGKLTDEQLHALWPRPGLNTFAKQFLEIAAVEREFANALDSGVLNFGAVPGVFEFPDRVSRQEISSALVASDALLQERLGRAAPDLVVDWGGGIQTGLVGHLSNLISHELFHHGQMLMAMYVLQCEIPEGWINSWSVPALEA